MILIEEMMMILEDVYNILKVPLEGKMIIVMIDWAIIQPYISDRYKTWEIWSEGMLIASLYRYKRVG